MCDQPRSPGSDEIRQVRRAGRGHAVARPGRGVAQGVTATTPPTQAADRLRRQPKSAFSDTRAIGVGLIIIGAALGIGGLAKAAVESMARQPETAGNIQTAMIIAAALIEGVTFFALIIVMLFVSPY